MTRIVNMHEAKSDLSRLVGQALAGEEVIIARAGTPVVRLTPLRQARVPGSAKGLVRIGPTLYDPLPEEIVTAFEGQ